MITRLTLSFLALTIAATMPQTATAGTHYTGDIVQGVKVIDKLYVADIKPGKHEFYFHAGWYNTGQPIHIPVIVIKGKYEGKRFTLTAGMHGDELNGIGVIHKLASTINYKKLHGSLLLVPGVNQTGLVGNNRHYQSANGGLSQTDLNRHVPGRALKSGSGVKFINKVWDHLLYRNSDIAIDIHTQTQGTAYPLFVFADKRDNIAWKMAKLLGADIIKNDKGDKGTLETSYVEKNIPAVTFELGEAKKFQIELIHRALQGITNVMIKFRMIKGEIQKPKAKPFIGNYYTNIYTKTGGVATLHVSLLDKVKAGDHVASLYDPFGRKIDDYLAPHAGVVLSVATDPLREAGALLVRIIK